MASRIMSSDNLTSTWAEISMPGGEFHIEGGEKDFYGWVYSTEGVSVAHGNGGQGP